jgi:hypothetical protein
VGLLAEGDTSIAPTIVAAAAALLAALLAAAWPTLRTWQNGRRFVAIIKRELEEIGPHPSAVESDSSKQWWEYLTKRFVHEELVARQAVQAHRDFLLGLNPSIVYHLSQLWISFDKRDRTQWVWHLEALSKIDRVASTKLRAAVAEWQTIAAGTPEPTVDVVRAPLHQRDAQPVERVDGLFEARLSAYRELLALIADVAGGGQPDAASRLADWYVQHGLLMSGSALHSFLGVRGQLLDRDPTQDLRVAVSALRTELKIDLGVRDASERDVPLERRREMGEEDYVEVSDASELAKDSGASSPHSGPLSVRELVHVEHCTAPVTSCRTGSTG